MIRLDGQVLYEDQPGGWTFSFGTAPHVRRFEARASVANGLYQDALGKPHGSMLELESSSERLQVKALTILGTAPTNHRDRLALIVADRRWVWNRLLIRRSYNVPRITGDRRRLPGIPLAVSPIEDDVAFAPWSLINDRRWTGLEVLQDVLGQLVGAGGYAIAPAVSGFLGDPDKAPVQALELVDGGAHALARVLAYFGKAFSVAITPSGIVKVDNRLSGGERGLVGAQPLSGGGTRTREEAEVIPSYEGAPYFAVQDRRQERPSKVLVHFARETEIRIDRQEPEPAAGTTTGGDLDPPRSDYVVELPEDATINGEDLVIGTYVKLDDYLTYLAGKQFPGLPELTLAKLRQAYISPAIFQYSVPKLDITGIWGRRISALRDSFRRRFQLRRVWLDRIRSIRPWRAAIRSAERGTRGPATVFTDYAEVSLWRAIEAVRLEGRDTREWHPIRNRYSNPTAAAGGEIIGTPIEDLQPAPARVVVESEDQGILFLAFATDFTGQVAAIYPTALEAADLPDDDPRASAQWLAWADASAVHEISVVLTVGMGAPNDLRQFHTVEVTADQVAGLVPTQAIGGGVGPALHVYVQPTTSVARFGWDDSKADEISEAWAEASGNVIGGRGDGAGDKGGKDLTDALGDPINDSEVNDVAKAHAARVYSALADRVEGQHHGGFRPEAFPVGTARSVSHLFGPAGASTIIDLPPDPPGISIEALLPMGTRRFVQRLVTP